MCVWVGQQSGVDWVRTSPPHTDAPTALGGRGRGLRSGLAGFSGLLVELSTLPEKLKAEGP